MDPASRITGFRELNALWLLFLPIIPNYTVFPPFFPLISHLSLSVNVGLSLAIDMLSPCSKKCPMGPLKVAALDAWPERQRKSVSQTLILGDIL